MMKKEECDSFALYRTGRGLNFRVLIRSISLVEAFGQLVQDWKDL